MPFSIDIENVILSHLLFLIIVYKDQRTCSHVISQNLDDERYILLDVKRRLGNPPSLKSWKSVINHSGEVVAVKWISNNRKLDCQNQLEMQFAAEIQILGRICHSNIVKLLCCISSETSKLLVYEYMENQSLDKWLHAKKRAEEDSASDHDMVLGGVCFFD